MRYTIRARAIHLIPAFALLASSCAPTVIEKPIFPRRADVQALVVDKPRATPEIVTDPEARAAHNAAVESWGIGGWLAGGRLCRWFNRMGADYDFCPPAPQGENADD